MDKDKKRPLLLEKDKKRCERDLGTPCILTQDQGAALDVRIAMQTIGLSLEREMCGARDEGWRRLAREHEGQAFQELNSNDARTRIAHVYSSDDINQDPTFSEYLLYLSLETCLHDGAEITIFTAGGQARYLMSSRYIVEVFDGVV